MVNTALWELLLTISTVGGGGWVEDRGRKCLFSLARGGQHCVWGAHVLVQGWRTLFRDGAYNGMVFLLKVRARLDLVGRRCSLTTFKGHLQEIVDLERLLVRFPVRKRVARCTMIQTVTLA